MRIRMAVGFSLILVLLASVGCSIHPDSSSFDNRFNAIIQPYTFNFASWEFKTLFNEIKQRVVNPEPVSALNSQPVIQYFSDMALKNTLQSQTQAILSGKMQGDLAQYQDKLKEVEGQEEALQDTVEQTLARQIGETMASLGIYNPIDNNFKFNFPPVNFKLEKPLYELVVSKRDKIERARGDITIKQDITPEQMQEIESSVDDLNVSSLVVQIGGLGGTYPSFVINNTDLRWTIDTAVHEWIHQYLAFRPLGFRYVLNLLGITHDASVTTINETVANMIGNEVGTMVFDRYYSQHQASQPNLQREPANSSFDFNKAMRDIRITVDKYLAQGQVEQAEQYMENQRQFLITKGYYIRKLNQAYFAFYGSYADGPSSIDPIGEQLRVVRQHSSSIQDFLKTVSGLKNNQDLSQYVSQYNQ